jgi:uncharacterized protein YdeI (YjbR/CyaY-like superfamily)
MDRVIVAFENAPQFEAWLEENHTQPTGIWLLIAKKASGRPSITYAQALECALCYGWIDGQKAKHDEGSWLQHFSRRKKDSIWSQVNQTNVARLIAEGRMQAQGLAAIEEAKQSGQWAAAYQPTKSREIPADLEVALAQSPKARAFFDTLGSQNRYAFVFRVSTAKRPETRAKRIVEFVQMMENGEVFYPKK